MSRGDKANTISRVRWVDELQAWQAHHHYSAREGLQKIFLNPLQNLLTCMVIAIALALPVAVWLVIQNAKVFSGHLDAEPQLTAYLDLHLKHESVEAVAERVRQVEGVLSVTVVSPEQGLLELQQSGAFGDLSTWMNNNPLPAVLLIAPQAGGSLDLKILQSLIEKQQGVSSVQMDLQWLERLDHMVQLIERGVWLLAFFLSLGVLTTVINTIALAIESRRDEIVVSKLVGATDAFVRRPLLYSGLWYGLGGGILACLILAVTGWGLAPLLERLLASYGTDLSLRSFGLSAAVALLALGGGLGVLGAWCSVFVHLRKINPA